MYLLGKKLATCVTPYIVARYNLMILITDAECSALDDPRNGQVTLTGSVAHATAFYSCSKGFILVGIGSRICGCDGRWSGTAPICKRKHYSVGYTA